MKQGRSLLHSASHHWILSSYKWQSTSFCPDIILCSSKWCLSAEDWLWILYEFLLCSPRSKCPSCDTIPVFIAVQYLVRIIKWGSSNCSSTSRHAKLTAMCWIFRSDWLAIRGVAIFYLQGQIAQEEICIQYVPRRNCRTTAAHERF